MERADGQMEIMIVVLAVVMPLVAVIFADDLRKLRRCLTVAFDFFRSKRNQMGKWYARTTERDLVATLVNNPEEATPVCIASLIDADRPTYWATQIHGGDAFRLEEIWKYRGFQVSLGEPHHTTRRRLNMGSYASRYVLFSHRTSV